jgi:sporulation protein YlmC with PRC-barrel domain
LEIINENKNRPLKLNISGGCIVVAYDDVKRIDSYAIVKKEQQDKKR